MKIFKSKHSIKKQFEADLEEAVQRSLKDQNREADIEALIGQLQPHPRLPLTIKSRKVLTIGSFSCLPRSRNWRGFS